MQELDVTWKRVLSVWWLSMWRGLVGGVILGGLFGGIVGVAAVAAGKPDSAAYWGEIFGIVVGVVWGFFVIKMALRKKYSEFRIVLVPHFSN